MSYGRPYGRSMRPLYGRKSGIPAPIPKPWELGALFENGEPGGWWSATDQFGVYEYFSARYARSGSRSGTEFRTGFVLDQSRWGGAELDDVLGPNVVANEEFNSTASWSGFGANGWSVEDGQAKRSTGTAGSGNISQPCLTIGKSYAVDITVSEVIAVAQVRLFLGPSGTPMYLPIGTLPGTYRLFGRCAGSTSFIIQSTGANGTVGISRAAVHEVPGLPAVQTTSANCPLYYAGGYLDHDGTDLLTVTFPSDPGTSTLIYSTISGVTITEGVEPGTSYNLPQADWFDCIVRGGTLTNAEKAAASSYLLRRRDSSLGRALAMWGDSFGAAAGASTSTLGWDFLLQGKFSPARPRFNGSVGGATSADMLTNLEASAYYRTAITILWDKINDAETVSGWLSNFADSVAYLGQSRYLILSPCNGTGEGNGEDQDYYDDVIAANAALASTYPDNYLDIRSYLIVDGLTDAGIIPTSGDLDDIAADTVPRSLLDATTPGHLNDAAHALVATQVYNFISAAGW